MTGGPGPAAPPAPGDACPCRSKRPFGECCGPILAEAAAPTAERLMRSRFSAFALGDVAHLNRSWHPTTRPPALELLDRPEWRGLQIVDTVDGDQGDDTGVVEFRATLRQDGRLQVLHERSRFVRLDGEWLYLDGEQRASDGVFG